MSTVEWKRNGVVASLDSMLNFPLKCWEERRRKTSKGTPGASIATSAHHVTARSLTIK